MRSSFADEGAHLRVATVVIRGFHVNETRLAQGGGLIEFAFGGRQTSGVFITIFLAEQADVNCTSANFIQVNVIGPAVGGGQVLEQENLEESAEQCVSANEVANSPAFVCQFLLHTANEDVVAHATTILTFPGNHADDVVFRSD